MKTAREISKAAEKITARDLAESRFPVFQFLERTTGQHIKIYWDGTLEGLPGEWMLVNMMPSVQSLSSFLAASLSPTDTDTSEASGLKQASPP
jgi:hypothetical protein